MAKDKQEITILEGNSFKGLKLKQKKKPSTNISIKIKRIAMEKVE